MRYYYDWVRINLKEKVLYGIDFKRVEPREYTHTKELSNERVEFVDIVLREYLYNSALLQYLPETLHKMLEGPRVDEFTQEDVAPVMLNDQEHLSPLEIEDMLNVFRV
jgi:hypothetical protein